MEGKFFCVLNILQTYVHVWNPHLITQKETHKAEDQKHAFYLLENILILF